MDQEQQEKKWERILRAINEKYDTQLSFMGRIARGVTGAVTSTGGILGRLGETTGNPALKTIGSLLSERLSDRLESIKDLVSSIGGKAETLRYTLYGNRGPTVEGAGGKIYRADEDGRARVRRDQSGAPILDKAGNEQYEEVRGLEKLLTRFIGGTGEKGRVGRVIERLQEMVSGPSTVSDNPILMGGGPSAVTRLGSRPTIIDIPPAPPKSPPMSPPMSSGVYEETASTPMVPSTSQVNSFYDNSEQNTRNIERIERSVEPKSFREVIRDGVLDALAKINGGKAPDEIIRANKKAALKQRAYQEDVNDKLETTVDTIEAVNTKLDDTRGLLRKGDKDKGTGILGGMFGPLGQMASNLLGKFFLSSAGKKIVGKLAKVPILGKMARLARVTSLGKGALLGKVARRASTGTLAKAAQFVTGVASKASKGAAIAGAATKGAGVIGGLGKVGALASLASKAPGLSKVGGLTAKAAGVAGLGGIGSKLLGKGLGKMAGKTASKGLLKAGMKKIPLLGAAVGLGLAGMRAIKGDWAGAGLEAASGLAGTIPGLGTAASMGLDAALMARDYKRASTPDKGVVDDVNTDQLVSAMYEDSLRQTTRAVTQAGSQPIIIGGGLGENRTRPYEATSGGAVGVGRAAGTSDQMIAMMFGAYGYPVHTS